MSRRRVFTLLKRAGIRLGPLAHVATTDEYRSAVERLSNEELREEVECAYRAWANTLTDDELLAELHKVRQQAAEEAT